MLIDWFTVIAQAVNFLVLVALLRRFLYGPIIRAMDQRQARIAAELEEAEIREREAEKEAQSYRDLRQELAEKREEMLAQAEREADERRQEMFAQLREEVDATRARWQRAVQHEKEAFLDDLRQRAGVEVLEVARRALADLADADLEREIVATFVDRVEGLDEDRRRAMARAVRGSEQGVVVQSAFALPEETRQRIVRVLRDRLSPDVDVNFRQVPDLIAGIELVVPGYRVAWSLKDYLGALEDNLAQAFAEEAQEETSGRGPGANG